MKCIVALVALVAVISGAQAGFNPPPQRRQLQLGGRADFGGSFRQQFQSNQRSNSAGGGGGGGGGGGLLGGLLGGNGGLLGGLLGGNGGLLGGLLGGKEGGLLGGLLGGKGGLLGGLLGGKEGGLLGGLLGGKGGLLGGLLGGKEGGLLGGLLGGKGGLLGGLLGGKGGLLGGLLGGKEGGLLGGLLGGKGGLLGGLLGGEGGLLGGLLGGKGGLLGGLLGGEGGLLGGLLGGKGGLLGGNKSLLQGVMRTLGSVTGLLNGKSLQTLLSGNVVGGLNELLGDLLDDNGILGGIIDLVEDLLRSLNIDTDVLSNLTKGRNGLLRNLRSTVNILTEGLEDVLDAVESGRLAKALDELAKTVEKTADQLDETVDDATDKIKESTDIDLNALDSVVDQVTDSVVELVNSLVPALQSLLDSGLLGITGTVEDLVRGLFKNGPLGSLIGKKGLVGGVLATVGPTLTDLLKTVGGLTGGLTGDGLLISSGQGKKGLAHIVGGGVSNLVGKLDLSILLNGNINTDVLVFADACKSLGIEGLSSQLNAIVDIAAALKIGESGIQVGLSLITQGGVLDVLGFTADLNLFAKVKTLPLEQISFHESRPILPLAAGLEHAIGKFDARMEKGRGKRIIFMLGDDNGPKPAREEVEIVAGLTDWLNNIGCELVIVQIGQGECSLDDILPFIAGLLQSGLCAVYRVGNVANLGNLVQQIVCLLLNVVTTLLNAVNGALSDVLCIDLLGDIIPGISGLVNGIIGSVSLGASDPAGMNWRW